MPPIYHRDVRTTLTLDEDVAKRLESEMRRSGRSFRDVVNETLRCGLAIRRRPESTVPFKVATRDLGKLRPGLSLDRVADLLEQVEGSQHR